MSALLVCFLVALAGMTDGYVENDGVMFGFGFFAFLLGVSMIDWASDRFNGRASDRLNRKGRRGTYVLPSTPAEPVDLQRIIDDLEGK